MPDPNFATQGSNVLGFSQIQEDVETIVSNFVNTSSFNAVSVASGLNIRTGTTDFFDYAFQTKGVNLLHDTLLVYGYTEISNNLVVKETTNLYEDVSMGAHLQVMGDVSFESVLDVSSHIQGHHNLYLDETAYISGSTYNRGCFHGKHATRDRRCIDECFVGSK